MLNAEKSALGKKMYSRCIQCMQYIHCRVHQFRSVQSLSRVRLFATPWISARQASLSITNSRSSPRLTSIESVMPSNHLILCCPFSSCLQSFPASGSFPMSQLFASGGQSIWVSASASILPMNTQDWSPLGWTGWSPCSARDSQESSPTPQFKSTSSSVLSLLYGPALTWCFLLSMIISRDLIFHPKNV